MPVSLNLENRHHRKFKEGLMFQIANNEKVSVLVQTRCSHTSMFHFLGLQGFDTRENDTLESWINSLNRVVVLRHPIERMHSAIEVYDTQIKILIDHYDAQTDKAKFIEQLRQRNPQHTGYFIENYFNIPDRNEVRDRLTFLVHSYPYMSHIVDYDFEIIKFENIEKYLPSRDDPIFFGAPKSGITKQSNRTYLEFPHNNYYTEAELLREVELYNTIIESKTEISVADWQSLITH